MCGPVVSVLYPVRERAIQFHAGRLLGYTTLGLIAGKLGALVYSLGFAALGIMGLAGVVLLIAGPKLKTIQGPNLARFSPRPFLLGTLFTFIPCHYLWTMVGVAALSGSIWSGGAIMAAHAIMSAVGIHAFLNARFYQRFKARFQNSEKWILALSVLLMLIRIVSQSNSGGIAHPTASDLFCW